MSAEDEPRRPGASDGAALPAEGEETGASPGPSVPVTIPADVPPLIVRSKQRARMGIFAICVVVLLVVAAVIGATVTGHSSSEGHAPLASPAASESLGAKLIGVPESVFESVGLPGEIASYPTKITGLPTLRASRAALDGSGILSVLRL